MAISLAKGQKVDLTKTNPGLNKIIVGLGWDVNKYDGGHAFDLDASVFLLDANGKTTSEKDFIFYGNPADPSNSVVHSGDNKTGAGEGDDETVAITLASIPASITKIDFTITIHDAAARNQNFGQVSGAYVRIMNAENNEELMKFDLGEDYSIETAVVVAELYRNGAEWKFNAIGSGFEGGLAALCKNFGIDAG